MMSEMTEQIADAVKKKPILKLPVDENSTALRGRLNKLLEKAFDGYWDDYSEGMKKQVINGVVKELKIWLNQEINIARRETIKTTGIQTVEAKNAIISWLVGMYSCLDIREVVDEDVMDLRL